MPMLLAAAGYSFHALPAASARSVRPDRGNAHGARTRNRMARRLNAQVAAIRASLTL